jgi:hypothetical protein
VVTKASLQFIRQASKKNTAQEPIAHWLAPSIHASTSGVYVHARNTSMHLQNLFGFALPPLSRPPAVSI